MKIAIDISPLQSGHKIRGVGFYLANLKDALTEHHSEHDFLFFTDNIELDSSVDLVHYPYFDPFFISLPVLKKYKTVVTVHDLTPLVFSKHFPVGIKGMLRWQLQKRNLKNVEAIITDSESSKQDIMKYTGVPDDKVSVTYLAAANHFKQLNKSVPEKLRKKYSLPAKFVLYVGDVTWNKNLPKLMEAIAQTGLPLVMIGKSLVQTDFDKTNPWNHDLILVQNMMKENNKIIPVGFVSDEELVAFYNAATVFIMPSIYEGFGLPVIEAMQSGCPVVTTKGGSLPEVSGDAAVYVNYDSVDSIAEGINQVFTNANLQKELTKKGIERAKKFNWKRTADQTVAVYQRAFNE